MAIINALTIDVEDYYHVSAFEPHVPRESWHEHPSRVERNTHRLLALLDRYRVRATFFVLGWVADRFPGLVRDIHAQGHEIGCHSYWHRLVYRQEPGEFREDLRRCHDAIGTACGVSATAYRAPSFSITRKTPWAHEILVEEGFLVDSSVFPIYHDRYGIPDAPPHPHEIKTPSGTLWEFPPSVVRLSSRLNLPVSGGGYFRLYPLWWTARCLRRINGVSGQPFMFYVHPWEFDPEQPRISGPSRLTQFRHHVNLVHSETKLARLLEHFSFGHVGDVLQRHVRPASQEPCCELS